jgi:hypothetical protein
MAFAECQSQRNNFDNGTEAIIKIDNPQKCNFAAKTTELLRRMSDGESRTGNRIRRNDTEKTGFANCNRNSHHSRQPTDEGLNYKRGRASQG